jgi:hypothetical protein
MTAIKVATMDDKDPSRGGQIARVALVAGGMLATLFGAGVAVGLVGAHLKHGGEIGPRLIALVAGALLFAAGSAYVAWRGTRFMVRASGAPTTRDRRNRTVLLVCGALGGVIGMALTLAGPTPASAFSNAPLPTAVAVALAFPIAVLLPILCVYWHRRVADEQEAAAYGKGALIGIYTYFIGAPTWWLLWRGGLVPPPDGIIIYFATITVTGAIWLWSKYR